MDRAGSGGTVVAGSQPDTQPAAAPCRSGASSDRDPATPGATQITRNVIAFNTARVRSRVSSFSRITDT